MYAQVNDANTKVFFDITIGSSAVGVRKPYRDGLDCHHTRLTPTLLVQRIVMELKVDTVPRTAENFRQVSRGRLPQVANACHARDTALYAPAAPHVSLCPAAEGDEGGHALHSMFPITHRVRVLTLRRR